MLGLALPDRVCVLRRQMNSKALRLSKSISCELHSSRAGHRVGAPGRIPSGLGAGGSDRGYGTGGNLVSCSYFLTNSHQRRVDTGKNQGRNQRR